MTRSRGVRWMLATLAVVGSSAVRPAAAQTADWTVGRDAFAELWYHALARVTPAGDSPVTLYSAAYVRDAEAARRTTALASRLDIVQPALREALRTERALEVLHFVPAYFVGEPPEAVLRALRGAFASARPPVHDALARRAALVAQAVPGERARSAAMQFVDAAADEWRVIQRGGELRPGPGPAEMDRLRNEWLREVEPALRPYLVASGTRRGRIVVVPSLGLDGRVVHTPDGAALALVGTGDGAGLERAPLLLAVRELAYPLVRRLPSRLLAAKPDAPWAAERARGVAAVRAGALLLDAQLPAMAPAYRALFAGVATQGDPRAFDALYAASAELDAALQSEVAHLAGPRGRTP